MQEQIRLYIGNYRYQIDNRIFLSARIYNKQMQYLKIDFSIESFPRIIYVFI